MKIAARIFATGRPSAIGTPVIPMDPREQVVLDELRARRDASRKQKGVQ